MTQYIDERGWCYRVGNGLFTDSMPKQYKGRYCKPGKDQWHGVQVLPWRDTEAEAQADLAAYAAKKGWRRCEG